MPAGVERYHHGVIHVPWIGIRRRDVSARKGRAHDFHGPGPTKSSRGTLASASTRAEDLIWASAAIRFAKACRIRATSVCVIIGCLDCPPDVVSLDEGIAGSFHRDSVQRDVPVISCNCPGRPDRRQTPSTCPYAMDSDSRATDRCGEMSTGFRDQAARAKCYYPFP